MKLKLNTLDLSLQTRAETNRETVLEYAELMREGHVFPPVKVFDTKTAKVLVDGYHRVAAATETGLAEIDADVIFGDRKAALTYALKANAENGLHRSNADKRRALEIAWENRADLFGDETPSNRQLAAICGVSHEFARIFILLTRGGNGCHPSPEGDETEASAVTKASAKKLLKEGKDQFGMDIPARLLPAFESTEVDDLRKTASGIRKSIDQGRKDGKPGFAAVGQNVLVIADNLLNALRFAVPFCVCRACRGDGCYRCNRRGFQTESQYRALPPEYQAKKTA